MHLDEIKVSETISPLSPTILKTGFSKGPDAWCTSPVTKKLVTGFASDFLLYTTTIGSSIQLPSKISTFTEYSYNNLHLPFGTTKICKQAAFQLFGEHLTSVVNVRTMPLLLSMLEKLVHWHLNNLAFIYLFIKIKWRIEKWLEFLCSFVLMNHTHKVNTLLVKLRYKRRELQSLLYKTI